ncbi:hypothetical protein [Streptomyces sp. NBC_01304]|uniref:hypothetical protein n=1 Tax=Streptomyces sp. NBC_01304 TaxID=2903818 RepID=UPI002E118022|nr:ABC transporter permease [Streptomyces sp. NBC_01304]
MSAQPTSAKREMAKAVVIVALVQFVVGGWFSWTASRSEPTHVPVAVVAGSTQQKQLDSLLTANGGDFDTRHVKDVDEAAEMLRDREVYGAFVQDDSAGHGWRLKVASAASPAVAAALSGQLAELTGTSQLIEEAVPVSGSDPHGSGMTMGFFPLIVTAVIIALLLVLKVSEARLRLIGVVAFAAVSGLLSSLMLTVVSDVLPGSFLTNAAAIFLLELGMAGFITGLGALVGPGGIAVGAVVMFLVGNPLSGIAAGPDLLPGPLGRVGQLLPPGAAGSFIRAEGSFAGTGSGGPLAVLLGWAVVALALLALAVVKGRRRRPEDARVLQNV